VKEYFLAIDKKLQFKWYFIIFCPMASLQQALQNVLADFPHVSPSEVKEELKSICGRKGKYDKFESELLALLDGVPNITKGKFVKIAKAVWSRKYPDGLAPRSSQYGEFVREQMPLIMAKYPNETHPEKMKRIGALWTEKKRQISQDIEDSSQNDENKGKQCAGSKRGSENDPPAKLPKKPKLRRSLRG